VAQERGPISVEARPGPFVMEPARTALIVVDMQHDFASERGMFARAGIPIQGIRAVVQPIARVADAARRSGILVIYLKMEFQPDLSDAGAPDAPNLIKHLALRVGDEVTAPDGRLSRVLIRDTWNTEIVPELAPHDGDIVVSKNRYSGFHDTDLDTILRERGIRSLLFTGCTTSVCVESTLRDAFMRDYRPLLLADCTAEPFGSDLARTNHEATLLIVERLFGWVSDSAALVEALLTGLSVAARSWPRAGEAGAP
jgi:ureidoacrylate peracid hydrolase